ncbi:MAG: hypothetical protein V7636_16 [Actinomycetota bacterium]
MIEVLGIEVGAELLASWAQWLAPDPQPFLVAPDAWSDIEGDDGVITPELRDTYRLWGVDKSARVLWLSEERFAELPRETRARLVREQVVRRRGAVPTVRAWEDVFAAPALREQADGHRFVWWPSLVATEPERILRLVISERRLTSRHLEVADATWSQCEGVLPNARALAGAFPNGSNENCFGTVLSASGHDTAGVHGSVQPFEEWLAAKCRPGGDSSRPGTVLVWRSDGDPVHGAVTIGDGWLLEKPSQEWHSPRGIARVADVVRTTKMSGQRLERHTLV